MAQASPPLEFNATSLSGSEACNSLGEAASRRLLARFDPNKELQLMPGTNETLSDDSENRRPLEMVFKWFLTAIQKGGSLFWEALINA